jgi:hypothetical protein
MRVPLFLSVCLFIYNSCTKPITVDEKISLPLETQDGRNTFGCYVNNDLFVPTLIFGNVTPVLAHYTVSSDKNSFLSIQGIDSRYNLDFAGSIVIQKLNILKEGDYELKHIFNWADPYSYDQGGYRNVKEDQFYFIETGKLTISKLDTVNKIISGRFYFSAKDTLGNRKEIKQGRFDIKYIY